LTTNQKAASSSLAGRTTKPLDSNRLENPGIYNLGEIAPTLSKLCLFSENYEDDSLLMRRDVSFWHSWALIFIFDAEHWVSMAN
jgi:hypothetical protein